MNRRVRLTGLENQVSPSIASTASHLIPIYKAALLEAGRLRPEVSDTPSVPWQILPLVQSIEVVDREVGYGFGLRQA